MSYHGRFAPSPTGPLHFGSLVAAVGSYLEAKVRGGRWSVRIEDVDSPRCVPGATDDILRTLESFGFAWDGPVWIQSDRLDVYAAALETLKQKEAVYPCACSRKAVAASGRGRAVDGGWIYPGTCRGRSVSDAPKGEKIAWRFRVPDGTVSFEDGVFGWQTQDVACAVGDFVLHRADGLFAYQLAVVVDDAAQGITEIVRGGDLLDSTARQRLLQESLNYPLLRYVHLPVVLNAGGEKLSKQTQAQALNSADPGSELIGALRFLGQLPPKNLQTSSLSEIWAWATEHWVLSRVPAGPLPSHRCER